jgi:hypothetical protein
LEVLKAKQKPSGKFEDKRTQNPFGFVQNVSDCALKKKADP